MNKGVGNEAYYNEHYGTRSVEQYNNLVALIVTHSNPGKVLDIGCGTAFLVEACSSWGIDCFGIDGSEDAIKIAKSRNPNLSVKHHYLNNKLDFPDGAFQTIVMNQVIEHLEDAVQDNCFKEIYRLLKKGGTVIIFSPSKYNLREKKADPTHINLLSPSELINKLQKHGFETVIPLNTTHRYKTKFLDVIFRISFKIFPTDILSATANVIAKK